MPAQLVLHSGHVDGIGTVTRFAQIGESWELRVLAPRHYVGAVESIPWVIELIAELQPQHT